MDDKEIGSISISFHFLVDGPFGPYCVPDRTR